MPKKIDVVLTFTLEEFPSEEAQSEFDSVQAAGLEVGNFFLAQFRGLPKGLNSSVQILANGSEILNLSQKGTA